MAQRRPAANLNRWSYSAGERGSNRVRVYERIGFGIWIDSRDDSGTRQRHPLGTTDRIEAKAKADEIAAKFRREARGQPTELTLAALIDSYERLLTPGKVATVQEHDRRAFALILRQFGANTKPRDRSQREWAAYIGARRSGRLPPPKAKAGGVRDRVLEQDLHLLNALLNWAKRPSNGAGGYLLDRNPLKVYPRPRCALTPRAKLQSTPYSASAASNQYRCFVSFSDR